MKKAVLLIAVILIGSAVWAQNKFALVIGNGNYANTTKLTNPVNDANDMAAALQGLGFTVDKVLNGTQDQMVNAVMQLKRRLSVSQNSYGFLFYAGHGVQSGGENYLIPVDAKIPSESFLRNRTVSVQEMLDELNNAGNEFNVVVLDACRDNPFGWKRSGSSRGLSVVGNPPADSLIVYATAAGSTSADGNGRNGLFTTHLLNNLKTTDLEVMELFRRTGADVARASNNEQRPAVYNHFFGIAYLGTKPAANAPVQSAPKIGDTGPAGGIVFYDKGNDSDGWRYLEAAPANTEFRAQWGAYEKNIAGTSTAIGAGKRNTQLIVEYLKTTGETGKAAQLCANLNFGGYNDWFLPSRDELDLIYKNLIHRNLGSFKTAQDRANQTHVYWSSSQYNNYVTWNQYFNDGFQNYATSLGKSDTFSVRAIRSF